MKIAYDHQIFGWQRFGGVSRYFFELANHLAGAEDGAVQCRIASPFHVNDYLRQAGPALQVMGVHAPAIRRTGRLYRMVNELLAPQFLRRWRPDILHETYYSRSTVAPKKTAVVVTVHDMIHELFPESFSRWDKTRKEKASAVRRADHVICVSENTRRDLVALLNVDPDKTSVVHHGYELLAGPTGLRHFREPFLLYVGGRGGYKNFDLLLQAYARTPRLYENFCLLAFGGGPLTRHEKYRINELSKGRWTVRQVGGDDALLADLYESAVAFVYPSLYEGFGIPPLEAMSLGCPVVCSNTSSIPEVVGGAALQFDPCQVDSIADALEAVSFDGGLRERLRQRGYGRISTFSWSRCAQETLNVYRKLL